MAQRGRPRGSKNAKPKVQHAQAADPAGSPHSNGLSDEQEHKLLAVHADAYVKALDAKKLADAEFKRICKVAKGEGVSLSDMKLAIELRDPAGEEKLRREFERKLQIARWSGMPVGEQASLFPDVDRTPLVERARAAGKRAGIEGKGSEENPHDPNTEAGREWEAGRVEGMGVKISTGLKPLAEPEPTHTLIAANRPDAKPVTSNDDETIDAATSDDEVGATDAPSVDADVVEAAAANEPYSEKWKRDNVPSAAPADEDFPDIPEHLDRRPKAMAEPDF